MTKSANKPRRTPARSRGAAKKPARPIKHTPHPLAIEAKYLSLAALGILLVLFVYVDGTAGFVGLFIKGLTVGVLGFGAYVLPFLVIAAAVYGLFAKTRRIPPFVFVCAAIFCWSLMALLHIATMKEPLAYESVFAYFGGMYTEGALKNGGLLGGLLGNFLRGALGPAGAYIVLIVSLLITLVLLSGRSFVSLMTLFAGGVRRYVNDRREERAYAAEYEDDYDTPAKRPESQPRRPKPLPPGRRNAKTTTRRDPALLVIGDKEPGESHRIMLINEEMKLNRPPHPVLAPRGVRTAARPAAAPPPAAEVPDTPKTIVPFTPDEPAMPADPPAAEMIDLSAMNDITVKGLVGGHDAVSDIFDGWDEDDTSPFGESPSPSGAPERGTTRPTAPKAAVVSFPSGTEQPLSYEGYEFPPISLLTKNQAPANTGSRTQILENSRILEETLKSFRVEAKVVEVSVGPTVTRYDLAPGPGVKVSSIANLSNDLALNLAAQGIRIEAPIPGKAAVGIEIPNKEPQPVLLREIIEEDAFAKFPSRLAFAVGKDIAGSPVVTDVGRMPHLLIAGATGSGKSVCINTLITSLLYKSRPDEVKLLMIDPKVVELSVYNGIPHLLIPVVTDPKKASGALSWAVTEMDNRYNLFAEAGVRDLKGYNEYIMAADEDSALLPQIVIIIDELADLMMVCKGEVEEAICRLAQKARAAGIHLIIATQRPSVDVITGLIKANIPSRLAFAVSSGIDSRTVLDTYGAEKLLGKGDMLFLPMGRNKPLRLQGCYVSDKEVEQIVDFLKKQAVTEYAPEMIEKVTSAGGSRTDGDNETVDEFFRDAVEFLLEKGKASTSMLQRQFRIGYNRASRLMEDLEDRGIVGPEDGVKPRKIMITREEFYNIYG